MLYLSFRVTLLFTSLMGLFVMLAREDYNFLFFPIVMFIWVFYTFFEEDDKEYRRRNGEYHVVGGDNGFDCYYDSWLYTGDTYPQYSGRNNSTKSYTNSSTKNDPSYKKIAKKCKRTLKITVYKEPDKNENKRN